MGNKPSHVRVAVVQAVSMMIASKYGKIEYNIIAVMKIRIAALFCFLTLER